MAANPQLTSYIRQQLGLGDTESSIKNNLRSVGWGESDIISAFQEASPSPAAQPAMPAQPAAKPASPSAPSFAPPAGQPMANPAPSMPNINPSPAAPKIAAPESRKINLENFAPMSSPSPIQRPFSASPAVMSFTAQPPMENIFQPKAANPLNQAPGMNPGPNPNPMPSSPMASMSPAAAAPKKSSVGSAVTMIILVLIIGGLGWFTWTLYQSNAGLSSQLNALNGQVSALNGQQSANSQSLASQMAVLQADNEDLAAQLGLFTATSSATTTLKGVIGGGGKLAYTLTTSRGITVTVKNSKDAKVSATLMPLVGTTATLTGIQTAGTKEITVTLVNGTAPALPAPPVATTATSTPPVAPAPAPAQ